MVPSPRSLVLLITVAVATTVSQAFGRFAYAVLLTDIRSDLGLSNTLAGSLGSLNLACYLAGSVVVTVVLGRFRLATVAAVGLGGVVVGLAALSWAPHVGVVALGLALTGVAAAGVWVTAPALAAGELGADRRGTAIGVITAGIGAGMIATAWFDRILAWRSVYRIELVVGLAAFVAMVLVASSDSFRSSVRGRAPSARLGFSAITSVPRWRSLLVIYGLFAAAMALAITFLVALLEDDADYSSGAAALAFSMVGVGTILGGPLFGGVADRVGRRAALGGTMLLQAVSILVAATGHRPGATIAAFCFGLSFSGGPVSTGAHISDFATGERFGSAYGVATLAFGAGLTVGPQLGGLVTDWAGSSRPAFVVAAAMAGLGAALVPMALSPITPSCRASPAVSTPTPTQGSA